MSFQPSEFIKQSRDEKREQDCSKFLRSLNDEEHSEFLWKILKSNDNSTQLAGCRLVARSMPNHAFTIDMLEYALIHCNVSSIGIWAKAILKNLGPIKTVTELNNRKGTHKEMVSAACYHLNPYYRDDTKASKLFRELKREVG